MSRGYRFVSHTADIAFIAYGSSYKELIDNSVRALIESISYVDDIKKDIDRLQRRSIIIDARSDDIESLIWRSLQLLISYSDAESLLPFSIESSSLNDSNKHYSAKISAIDDSPYYRKFDVKAVTLHNLKLNKNRSTYSIKIVLDV
ncbi:MAG: protein archease [Candidatus Micrarchaeota archaeon]|nr:MAG: protein archease [Candidatus Micrarchaeota archaeon]